MSDTELETYRQHLLAAQSRLYGDVEHLEEEVHNKGSGATGGSLSHLPQHLADLASDSFEAAVTVGLLESQGQTLAEIVDALGRIARGTFGRCEECAGDIGRERLRALPQARHCFRCARALQAEAAHSHSAWV
jgi:RNA polymerase-binding transcription factor DksA